MSECKEQFESKEQYVSDEQFVNERFMTDEHLKAICAFFARLIMCIS